MSIDPNNSNSDRQNDIPAMSEPNPSTEEPPQIEETIWSLSEVIEELRTAEEDIKKQNIYLVQERQKYQGSFIFSPDVYLVNTTLKYVIEKLEQTAQSLKKSNKELEDSAQERTDELLRANRSRDEFLANMSHELRTPLNAILGLAEALQEELLGPLSERQQKSISIVISSGKHLLSLINDILEVSKIEAGKLELDLVTVSVKSLCKSSLAFVNQQAFDRDIKLTTIFAPNLGNITIDERRMRQVLINLLANGVKFTPAGGKVTLEVKLENSNLDANFDQEQDILNLNWILISVKDTGIGITPENQSKLFQPFVQVDSSLNRQYEGAGLGLMLVKQIVELHGGGVTVASEVDRGSCFVVRLPYNTLAASNISTVSSIDPIDRQNSIDSASSETQYPLILIAEDNQSNLYSLSTYLQACNYRIIFAENGLQAVAMAENESPDIILMDIQMPGIDGIEAIEIIRKNPKLAKIPIIALTALAMNSDKEKCLAAGANEYLAKPVKMRQLRTTIQQLLSGFTGFKDEQD